MQLANEGVCELGVKILSLNDLLKGVSEVVLDERFHVTCLHFVYVFHCWEKSIVWVSNEDLTQVACTSYEFQILLLLSLLIVFRLLLCNYCLRNCLGCAEETI